MVTKLEELIAEKRAAGLTREQAEDAVKRQIEWDATDPHDPPPVKKKGTAAAVKPEPKGEGK